MKYLTSDQTQTLARHITSFTEPGYAEFVVPLFDEDMAFFVEESAAGNTLTPHDQMIKEIQDRLEDNHTGGIRLSDDLYRDLESRLGHLLGQREHIDKRGRPKQEDRDCLILSVRDLLPATASRSEIVATLYIVFEFVGIEYERGERYSEIYDELLRKWKISGRSGNGETIDELWRMRNET